MFHIHIDQSPLSSRCCYRTAMRLLLSVATEEHHGYVSSKCSLRIWLLHARNERISILQAVIASKKSRDLRQTDSTSSPAEHAGKDVLNDAQCRARKITSPQLHVHGCTPAKVERTLTPVDRRAMLLCNPGSTTWSPCAGHTAERPCHHRMIDKG